MRKSVRILTNLRRARNFNEFAPLSNLTAMKQSRGLATLPARKHFEANIGNNAWIQSIRQCSVTPPIVKECWKCEKTSEMWNYMICDECGCLQDVEDINYFDLLNCERKYLVDPMKLTRQFRELQTFVHPDKYNGRPKRELFASYAWSSLVNRAYKTLSVPVDRGEYLLNMKGVKIPEGTTSLNKEFLSNMMDRHSEIEEATTKKDLFLLQKRIADDVAKKIKELNKNFEANDLEKATASLVELKYLISIQKSTKEKLDKAMQAKQ